LLRFFTAQLKSRAPPVRSELRTNNTKELPCSLAG
jgi:hypothetical protein